VCQAFKLCKPPRRSAPGFTCAVPRIPHFSPHPTFLPGTCPVAVRRCKEWGCLLLWGPGQEVPPQELMGGGQGQAAGGLGGTRNMTLRTEPGMRACHLAKFLAVGKGFLWRTGALEGQKGFRAQQGKQHMV
jgi:hypothetical protein